MKITKIAAFLLGLVLLVNANAQEKGYGLGLMIGEPTGISGKYWIDEETALSGGLAYSFTSANKGFSFHADYIYHIPSLIQTNEKIPFYYGFGFRIRTKEKTEGSLGVRGVAGIVWQRNDYPLDIFLEAAPVFKLLPETNLDFDAALGIRYYFNRLFPLK